MLWLITFALTATATDPSWSVNVSTDLDTRQQSVSALLIDFDESRNPIMLKLGCDDGRPSFSFSWHNQRGPEMMVVKYGEADSDLTLASFRRDPYSDFAYRFDGNVDGFMRVFASYRKPTLILHYTGGSQLWVSEVKHTAEAWSKVVSACKPLHGDDE